jgi:hypothetical protein
MFNALAISQIYVLDQDQALEFYVGKLGLEVNTDADLGFMRWLTVNVPGDARQILLEKPGAPALDVKTAEQVRELVMKGATGGHLFFTSSLRSRPSARMASIAASATPPEIIFASRNRFRCRRWWNARGPNDDRARSTVTRIEAVWHQWAGSPCCPSALRCGRPQAWAPATGSTSISTSTLNKRRFVLSIEDGKSPETRQRRIAKTVTMLGDGRT